jgi:hypothetical protein
LLVGPLDSGGALLASFLANCSDPLLCPLSVIRFSTDLRASLVGP